MAATRTRKPAKPVIREEVAETVVHETTTAEATARELVASFRSELTDKDARLFEQARIAFAGISTGAKPNDIAKATTSAMADTFPAEARAWAEANSVQNGGAKVTRVTIVQRSDAYGSILSAGIESPTAELVALAFRAFTSKGAPGLAEGHKKLIAATLKRPAGEREAYYVAHARKVSADIVAKKKAVTDAAHSEKMATKSADAKAEKPVFVADDTFTALAFIDAIKAGLALEWSEGDRAEIMAALATIVAE